MTATGNGLETHQVMLNGITYRDAKAIRYDLSHREERGPENNIANRPSIVQSPNDEDELQHDVYHSAGAIEDVHDDPKRGGLGGRKAGNGFEGGNGNEEDDSKDSQRGEAKELRDSQV